MADYTINSAASKEVLAELATQLKKGKSCKITNLGIFEVRAMKARKGRNPKTGESIQIAARQKIAFRVSKTFKDEVLK